MNNTADETIIGRGWAFPLRTNARGMIALTSEKSEIEQAIIIILSTPIGTRVMRPTFGSHLHELTFSPNNIQTTARAQRFVEEALGMWEPRIRVKGVQVASDPEQEEKNCLLIQIDYEIKATRDSRSLVHPFYLIPEER
jgi:phage baseplate assembly protein W